MGRRLRFLPYDRNLVEITNRTIQGRYLLRPTKAIREVIVGALGRAQRRYGVEIHAFVFLSNHYHLLISVRDAHQMSQFVGYFESKIAKEISRRHGWRDKIWGRRYSSVVVSQEEAAQISRLKYLLSQGVKEGLVTHPSDWPGAHSVAALLEGSRIQGVWHDRTAEYGARTRGRRYEARDFAYTELVQLTPLPCWQRYESAELQERIRCLVQEVVDAAPSRASINRKLLLGIEPTDSPGRSKRSPAPWFHCASSTVRRELRAAYGLFLISYREAAARWRECALSAPFPDGCFPPPPRFQSTR